MKYIIAHDFGTSAVKSCIYSDKGELVRKISAEYASYCPHSGWVEQDSEDWWKAFCDNTKYLVEGITAEDILCVTFDGVTAASVCCDSAFKPLHRAILWQDGRSVEEGLEISAMLNTPELKKGRQFMGPGRTSVQMYWVKKHHPEIMEKASHIILTNSNYVCSRLIGKAVTDTEIAATGGWMLADRSGWDLSYVNMLGIPSALLPEVYDMTDVVGTVTSEETARECGLAVGTKVMAGGDDGGTVVLGAGVVHEWDASMTCGTSGSVSVYMHNKFPGTNAAGASLNWLRKNLCAEYEKEAQETGANVFDLICAEAEKSPIGSNGVVFLPYLAGERGTRRNPKTRGTWTGFGLDTTKADIIRSVIEGIAFNYADIARRYREDGIEIKSITSVGGLTKNPVVRQIFADVLNAEIVLTKDQSWSGPTGCAMYASITMGICKDIYEASDLFVTVETRTAPIKENAEEYAKLLPLFENIYQSQLPIYDQLFELRKQ